jgi:hypothetical protein
MCKRFTVLNAVVDSPVAFVIALVALCGLAASALYANDPDCDSRIRPHRTLCPVPGGVRVCNSATLPLPCEVQYREEQAQKGAFGTLPNSDPTKGAKLSGRFDTPCKKGYYCKWIVGPPGTCQVDLNRRDTTLDTMQQEYVSCTP